MAREIGRRDRPARQLVAALEHVRIGDLLAAHADLDGRAVIAARVVELLEQVASEGGRLGDGGGVDAGPLEFGDRRAAFAAAARPAL